MENTPHRIPPAIREAHLTYLVSLNVIPQHQEEVDHTVTQRLRALGNLAADGRATIYKSDLRDDPQDHEFQVYRQRQERAEQLLASADLTARERQIATLIKLGKSNQDMADYLGRSLTTIKTLASRVYRKTGIHDRDELAARLNGMTKEEWYDPLGLYAQDQRHSS